MQNEVLTKLDELELVIERGFPAFVQVGEALAQIRERELYKPRGYATFAQYGRHRWRNRRSGDLPGETRCPRGRSAT